MARIKRHEHSSREIICEYILPALSGMCGAFIAMLIMARLGIW